MSLLENVVGASGMDQYMTKQLSGRIRNNIHASLGGVWIINDEYFCWSG